MKGRRVRWRKENDEGEGGGIDRKKEVLGGGEGESGRGCRGYRGEKGK